MKKMKQALSFLLVACMVVALAATAFAASYTDTDGHWAEEAIERWTSLDIVNGYTDGEYKPGQELTRAEAAVIFARLLKLEKKADISNFTDVAENAWYYEAIAKVVARGIMIGKTSSSMDPTGTLTREEFFTMLVRAIGLPTEEKSEKTFTDGSSVTDYAVGSINTLVNGGYLNGYPDGSLKPQGEIIRAEIVNLLHQTVAVYANEDGKEVVAPENGVVIVVADDVTVKSEKNEEVTVVVAKEEGTVTVETAGAVSVVADSATVNVAEKNTVYVNAADTTIAATEKAEVVVNAEDATVSLEGTTAEVAVTVAKNNVEITDAPKGTSVAVEETVTGTVVNEDKVASDSSYVVGEEPTSGHTHSYGTVEGWYKTTQDGVTVYKYGYQCTSCGDVKTYSEAKTLTLTADMTYDAPLYIAKGQNITIDLAGYNIVADGHDAIYNYGTLTLKSDGFVYPELKNVDGNLIFDETSALNTKGSIIVKGVESTNGIVNNAKLTIEGCAITVVDDYGSAVVSNAANAETTIKNAVITVTGLGNGIYVINGNVELNEGTVVLAATYGFAGLTFGGKMTVNGGSYYSMLGMPFAVAAYKYNDTVGTIELTEHVVTARDNDEPADDNYIEAKGGIGEIYWLAGSITHSYSLDDIRIIASTGLEPIEENDPELGTYADYFANLPSDFYL